MIIAFERNNWKLHPESLPFFFFFLLDKAELEDMVLKALAFYQSVATENVIVNIMSTWLGRNT